jgi:hypothetical protein
VNAEFLAKSVTLNDGCRRDMNHTGFAGGGSAASRREQVDGRVRRWQKRPFAVRAVNGGPRVKPLIRGDAVAP